MPTAPVSTLQSTSKKRKRPADQDVNKMQSVEVNLDKLMQKLGDVHDHKQGPKKKHRNTSKDEHATSSKKKEKLSSTPASADHSAKGSPTLLKKTKHKKPKLDAGKSSSSEKQPRVSVSPAVDGISGLTSLQKGMKESLDGARFRYVF